MPTKEKNAAANRQHQQLRSDAAVLSARPLVTQWEKMVVNPISVGPSRSPSLSPYTGAARTFVRTFDVQSSGAGSAFSFAASANLENCFRIQRAAALTLDAAGWSLTALPTVDQATRWLNFPTLAGNFTVYDSARLATGKLRTAWDSVNELDYVPMSGDATTAVSIQVRGGFTWYYTYARVGGAWVAQGDNKEGGTVVVTPAAVFDGIMVTVAGAYGQMLDWTINSSAGTTPTLGVDESYNLFSTDAATIGRVSSYRVTALSILASYSGSTLDNGGTVAAARTRRGFHVEAANPYQALTKLQDHCYRGTLKEGAYVWWLPYDFSELDPRPPYVYDEGTELHVAGHFDNADASLQVTVCMVVEFYSPLQIFEHEVGPALTDEFVRGYHAMDAIPAATCNPKHDALLKKLVQNAQKGVKKAGNFALSNPEMVAMLASSLL